MKIRMTSEYPVLDNRPIDKWKVTELKDELKRRKLPTKGLKEELIRRLDEALRIESGATVEETDNGVNEPESEVVEVAKIEAAVVGESEMGIPVNAGETVGGDNSNISEVETASVQVDVKDRAEQPHQEEVLEQKESELVNDQHTGMELSSGTDVPSAAMGDQVSESLSLETVMGGQRFEDDKPERDNEDSRAQQDSEDVKPPHEDVKLDSSDPNNQVSEVSSNLGFPLKSNSNSTDSVSICEKKELEDNVIADNVKLEPDVKPEMVQPSSSDLVPDGGESHPKGVEEPLENELSVGGRENNVANADMSQTNLSAGLGSSEKLNLDRSSGDDSMEEDGLESKQIDSNDNTGDVGVRIEKNDVTTLKEVAPFTAMDTDLPAEEKSIPSEDKDVVAAAADKRKLPDHEAGLNSEPSKRQRRWKSEGSNIREQPPISNITSPVVAKDVTKSAALLRNFSRSDSDGAVDTPKEREVPPSTKAATSSLRIDNFLRPFTLKAVQDLLGKTGTVTSFWMDHIKTHCYATYSTVEEAVATRNAVYNLQWPPNGGRYLVAEFVDPQEVKVRVDPPQPAIAPVRAAASSAPEPPPKQQQPSPRQQDLRQQLISRQTTLPLPPPPPLSNSLPARERVHPIPPPPPPEEKEEAPILTLDDLFRKTKTTPRIYYLPLSEEQVSSILEARKNSGQPPIA